MVCQTEIRCVCSRRIRLSLPVDFGVTVRWMFPSNTSWLLHIQSKHTTTAQSWMSMCQNVVQIHCCTVDSVELLWNWSCLTFVKVYQSLRSREEGCIESRRKPLGNYIFWSYQHTLFLSPGRELKGFWKILNQPQNAWLWPFWTVKAMKNKDQFKKSKKRSVR